MGFCMGKYIHIHPFTTRPIDLLLKEYNIDPIGRMRPTRLKVFKMRAKNTFDWVDLSREQNDIDSYDHKEKTFWQLGLTGEERLALIFQ